MKKYTCPSILSIAGFDGSGGAGIQADIKTISALGCFATSVLTALPVQNTQGVRKVYPISEEAVAEQIETLLDDIFPQAIKIGMVHTPRIVEVIAQTLAKYKKVPLIFDPVMVATSGHMLIKEDTLVSIVQYLLPLADLITPNLDEAEVLTGMKIKSIEDMRVGGELIAKQGCKNILLKGGHLEGPRITSLFFEEGGKVYTFETEKFQTNNTHGSGCTLSAAIAAYVGQGKSLLEAVDRGQKYVFEAIRECKEMLIGKGNGPLNHFFNPQKLIKSPID
ncbi:bifunctional hydroxymethylpyrimidine kinase/phosphomethylpyrimidine kinase [Elizabethkingia argentiflava]|uniref:hydroxymethylpyrimidine kinase n=1 Tax=Elizabethkingia argenteiflava TaxID=2681556 RepID=A0A845PVZ4_9FLAO|nr:bifunctional hydroxymethylpyrimidine kinase/phosphomethylpyrimidine kinase [Elizabethkingia argenteiflava]NAW50280.1 bifunctional hydroxymethylpyrimidine kinase/phosphomethylpyrimidine kinase [Elizabethkingia argenteiflava]